MKIGSKLAMALIMIVVLMAVGVLFAYGAKLQSEAVWIAWLGALVAIPTQYGITNAVINGQASRDYRPELAGQPPAPPAPAAGPPA